MTKIQKKYLIIWKKSYQNILSSSKTLSIKGTPYSEFLTNLPKLTNDKRGSLHCGISIENPKKVIQNSK